MTSKVLPGVPVQVGRVYVAWPPATGEWRRFARKLRFAGFVTVRRSTGSVYYHPAHWRLAREDPGCRSRPAEEPTIWFSEVCLVALTPEAMATRLFSLQEARAAGFCGS